MESVSLGIGTALILGIWAYVAKVTMAAPGLSWEEPIVSGAVAGLVIGDLTLGLQVGATLTLMSLGMHTYGGATIPDFTVGAILGTVFGAVSGGSLEAGLAIAVPAALVMTQLDIFRRAITTVFIHAADNYVEKANWKGFTLMHILGQIPRGAAAGIPVFIAIWLGAGPVQAFMDWMPEWFMDGIGSAGRLLPALGFALLLGQLPVKKYIPFLLLGYVMFAYLNVPVMGIAITAVAVGALYMRLKNKEGEAGA